MRLQTPLLHDQQSCPWTLATLKIFDLNMNLSHLMYNILLVLNLSAQNVICTANDSILQFHIESYQILLKRYICFKMASQKF